MGLPDGFHGKESIRQCRRCEKSVFIPQMGRSPGKGNGNPLQCSCLGNPMEGGARGATVHGVAKCWTGLSTFRLYYSSQCHLYLFSPLIFPMYVFLHNFFFLHNFK